MQNNKAFEGFIILIGFLMFLVLLAVGVVFLLYRSPESVFAPQEGSEKLDVPVFNTYDDGKHKG